MNDDVLVGSGSVDRDLGPEDVRRVVREAVAHLALDRDSSNRKALAVVEATKGAHRPWTER